LTLKHCAEQMPDTLQANVLLQHTEVE